MYANIFSFPEGMIPNYFTGIAGYCFNYCLKLINSYSISNCTINAKDLYIRISNQVENSSLPCTWKKSGNFAFEDLSIKNISAQTKTIDVWLVGFAIGESGKGMQGGNLK